MKALMPEEPGSVGLVLWLPLCPREHLLVPLTAPHLGATCISDLLSPLRGRSASLNPQHRATVGCGHPASGSSGTQGRGLHAASWGSASTRWAPGASDTSVLVMGSSPPGSSGRLL